MIKLLSMSAALALVACSSAPGNLAATERSAQQQCVGIDSGLTQLTSQTMQQLQQRQFLREATGDTLATAPPAQEWLIAVSHGAQPTPGYRFELLSATLSDGVAHLNLHWTTPPADSIQATVMTNPCLVLALPQGSYQRVVARDQNGVIGSLDLTP